MPRVDGLQCTSGWACFFGGGICFKNKTLESVFRARYDGKNEVKEGSNWKNWVG